MQSVKPVTQIKAMILAAGRGKRLRPLTDSVPKPLVALAGKPLIEYHLEKLAAAGVQEVIINHAWLGNKIEEMLGDGRRWNLKITYSPEPEGGLETAGGIINALPLLGDKPFLVINGDVFCEMDFNALVQQAEKMGQCLEQSKLLPKTENDSCKEGHVVLVPSPKHNQSGDFGLSENCIVAAHGAYTFAGLSVLAPSLFVEKKVDFIPLAPILRDAMQKGHITGQLENGLWSDVGTIERLQETEAMLKASQV